MESLALKIEDFQTVILLWIVMEYKIQVIYTHKNAQVMNVEALDEVYLSIFIDLWQLLPPVRFACFWPLGLVSQNSRVSVASTLSITHSW